MRVHFGKLFGVATLIGFDEKRCRKNLPFDAPRSLCLAPERTLPEFVVHVARLYHLGVICPTETWNQIHDATANLDAIALFNGLGDAERALIRGIHLERPGSLENLAKSSTDSQFPAMLDWCVESDC